MNQKKKEKRRRRGAMKLHKQEALQLLKKDKQTI